MADIYIEYANQARTALRDGDYGLAGDRYTASAYAAFAEGGFNDRIAFGSGVASLLTAVVCYRLLNETDRARNRSKLGLLVLEDLREYVFTDPVQKALTHELAGDFQITGGMDSYKSEYATARAIYEECSNHFGWMGEPEFELPIIFFVRLAESVDWKIDQETKQAIWSRSLTERVDYKKEYFGEILERILEEGRLDFNSEQV